MPRRETAEEREFRQHRWFALLGLTSPLLILAAIGGVYGVLTLLSPSAHEKAEACRAGDSYACREAFDALADEDDSRGEAWALGTELCAKGDFGFCMDLEYLLRDHPGFHGALTLKETYERACASGHANICGLRGSLSVQGVYMPRDEADARTWITLACERGSTSDCGYIGEWLIDGSGGPVDRATGMRYLEVGCLAASRDESYYPGSAVRNPVPRACERLAKEKTKDLTAPSSGSSENDAGS